MGIIVGLFVISLIIFVHELGHYVAAKIVKVKVEKFSIGIGKPFFSFFAFDTLFSISPILFGGYVQLYENDKQLSADSNVAFDDVNKNNQLFSSKKLLPKIFILANGSIFNVIFGFIAIYTAFGVFGVAHVKPNLGIIQQGTPAYLAGIRSYDKIIAINNKNISYWEDVVRLSNLPHFDIKYVHNGAVKYASINTTLKQGRNMFDEPIKYYYSGLNPTYTNAIGTVMPSSPAYNAGLRSEDIILKINNKTVNNWLEIVNAISSSPNETMLFHIKRKNNVLKKYIKPSITPNGGRIGITFGNDYIFQKFNLVDSMNLGFKQLKIYLNLTVSSLKKLIFGQINVNQLSGPITIVSLFSTSNKQSINRNLLLAAFISINIGLINLIPFPVLDGGKIVIEVIESVSRRELNHKFKYYLNVIGVVMLIMLFVYVSINDIVRLIYRLF